MSLEEKLEQARILNFELGQRIDGLRRQILTGKTTGNRAKDFAITAYRDLTGVIASIYQTAEHEIQQAGMGKPLLYVTEEEVDWKKYLDGGEQRMQGMMPENRTHTERTLHVGAIEGNGELSYDHQNGQIILPVQRHVITADFGSNMQLVEGPIVIDAYNFPGIAKGTSTIQTGLYPGEKATGYIQVIGAQRAYAQALNLLGLSIPQEILSHVRP